MRKTVTIGVFTFGVVFTVVAQYCAGVTITETTAEGQPAVVLENDFICMTFVPAKGGECVSFLYKPTNKQFVMPGVGSLVGNRVWNYADKELYRQWQVNPWEHEIKRTAHEVTLVLRAPGKVGFTRSCLFEKSISLREGEGLARVTYVFHVGQELMVPQKIGLWFFNQCGMVGEQCIYTIPLDDGIVSVDPAAGIGQEWFYNPSRGWMAVVGTSGTGLCFNMEYRRLMCFYLCPGRQPTFEWAFRTTDVANGDSLRTEALLVPFSGLPRVNGAGGGIVAAFETPQKCTMADVQKGIFVKVHLYSALTQSGELSVEMSRLPDGQPQNVLRQRVTLEAGKPASYQVTIKPAQEGTWALTGRVSAQGKEIMDFMTPLVVGTESAPFRIAAKEERIGRPTERFEDQAAVRGTAPKDIELSMSVETEHIKWAKPYHKGKLRVMVLTSCLNGREAVELAQRMDMDIIWVSAGTQSELDSYSGIFGRYNAFRVEHTNDYIKENLTRPCDAILIGGLRGDLFTDEVIELFRRKVSEGVGLVYVGPNRCPDKLYDLLPVQKETALRRHDGEWRIEVPHFITIGIPLEELPRTDYAEFKAKGEVLATVGPANPRSRAPLIVVQDGPGKGRVVVLNYNTGWQGNGAWKCGITPWLRVNQQGSQRQPPSTEEARFKYWEYHFSLLIKALLWAAHREPDLALQEISVETAGPAPKLNLRLSASISAQAEVRISDAYGVLEHEGVINVNSASCQHVLPPVLAGGLHIVDVILKTEGKVLTWGSVAFRIDRGLSITRVAFDKKSYRTGEAAELSAELSAVQPDVTLRAEFIDSLGRLIARDEHKADAQLVKFRLPIVKPLATVLKARVTALRGEQPLAVAECDTITLPDNFAARAWEDWESCIWGTPAGAYERDYLIPARARAYREYGFTTVLASSNWTYDTEYDSAVRAGFKIMIMNASYGALNVGHRAPKGKMGFEEARTLYQKTHDKKYLVRPVCLNNPADLADTGERLRKLAEFCAWLEPIGYNLGDEMSITHYVTPFDYDFGEHCLGVFRKWLQERYGTLEALNQEWETDFATWDQVMPMTAFEVKDRNNFAPWADHREFMDVTFANFFKWVRDTLREKDPRATVGMSGSQAAEAYGGYDWYRLMHTLDFIQNYTHQDTIVMQRSFDGLVPRAPWYGYMVVNPAMRQFLWRCLLNQNYGGSYFSDSYIFYPDLTPIQSTKDAAPIVAEFQSGLAKMLRNAERINEIGVHYSHPSIRGAFISGADALFRDNRSGWILSLQDLGYQCEMLATPQIEAGELAKRKYRAFILPYSVALSEKEAVALRQYVESGGLLIADAKVGLMDEHCRTLKAARLDDLFGVSRAQVDALCASREGEARFTQDRAESKLSGLTLDISVPEPGLKVAGGIALGQHGDAPIAIVKQTGKGTAVLLNLFMESYGRRRDLGMEVPLRKMVENLLRIGGVQPVVQVFTQATPAPHFYTVRYCASNAEYLAVQYDMGGTFYHDVWKDKKPPAVEATIDLPSAERFVYDVRGGKFLGKTKKIQMRIEPGDTALFALLPYEVKVLKIDNVKSVRLGEPVRYKISLQSEVSPAPHVFRLTVTGPDGQSRPHYSATLLAQQGEAESIFPLALNDPAGKWTLRAQDIATKVCATAEVIVTP